MNLKNKYIHFLIIAVVVVATILGGTYFFISSQKKAKAADIMPERVNASELIKAKVSSDIIQKVTDRRTIKQPVSLQGKIQILVMDNFAEKTAEEQYYFVTNENGLNKKYRLYFKQSEPPVFTNSSVKIQGTAYKIDNPASPNVLMADTVTSDTTTSFAPPPPSLKNIIVIMVNWKNKKETPFTPTDVNQAFFDNKQINVNKFYLENSFGKFSLDKATSRIVNWITLPYSFNEPDTQQYCNFSQWTIDADEMVNDPKEYTYRVYVFPAFIGCEFLSAPAWAYVNDRYMGLNGNLNVHSISHELGHMLGLRHANLLDCGKKAIDIYTNCYDRNIGNPLDLMGNTPVNIPMHFNAAYKSYLGWIPPANVKQVSTTGTYTIANEEKASAQTQLLRIDRASTKDYYYIDYKITYGFDTTFITPPPGMVLVNIWSPGSGWRDTTKLLDATPGDYNSLNAGLVNNNYIFDRQNKLIIQDISRNATSAKVYVNFLPSAPAQNAVWTILAQPVCLNGGKPKVSFIAHTVTWPTKKSANFPMAPLEWKDDAASPNTHFVYINKLPAAQVFPNTGQYVGMTDPSGNWLKAYGVKPASLLYGSFFGAEMTRWTDTALPAGTYPIIFQVPDNECTPV